MRINVYSQELTKEVKVVSKKAADTGITFWVPNAQSFTPADLARVFREMADKVEPLKPQINE